MNCFSVKVLQTFCFRTLWFTCILNILRAGLMCDYCPCLPVTH